LFNHESPRRPDTFVTRKITKAAARIACGLQTHLTLGSLEPERDWGYAGDFVQGMWLMLQRDQPDDFLFATGTAHSVKDFVEAAFRHVGLDYRNHIQQDPKFLRPKDVRCRLGDPTKARTQLGWQPRVGFNELVQLMVEADLQQVAQETKQSLRQAG
ncbi:MAG: GDP-mannose 4,6-dehydratase, partial [Planctomycetaceae bacterium]|nr:GDP-mannose 4,6-dehydratase [Planctomycetaceae bacterium]